MPIRPIFKPDLNFVAQLIANPVAGFRPHFSWQSGKFRPADTPFNFRYKPVIVFFRQRIHIGIMGPDAV